jgi:hypothetical protein
MPVNPRQLMLVFGGPGSRFCRVIPVACAASLLIGVTTAMALAEGLQRFDLRIENGRLAGNLKTVRVQRNDAVEINWSADRRIVLHLHGYDIETVVEAGKPQTMSFTASATGRFPVETHGGRHVVLLYIEVHPR